MRKSELRRLIREEILKEAKEYGPFNEYDFSKLAKELKWKSEDAIKVLEDGLAEIPRGTLDPIIKEAQKMIDVLSTISDRIYPLESKIRTFNKQMIKQGKTRKLPTKTFRKVQDFGPELHTK